MTEPVSGRQPVLAWLLRLLWAAALVLPVFGAQAAVVFTSLHSFSRYDGESPTTGLVQGSDGNFYGTTSQGGTNDYGTVFKMGTDGALTSLYSFTGDDDGSNPYAGLVQGSDGSFYGTTFWGGTNGEGTVFKISTNGALTTLHFFTGGTDGAQPTAALVQGGDGNFYGTTQYGGTNNFGTVFKISTDGALTTLHSFTGTNDGANPTAGLVQGSDASFYGTTYCGGTTNHNAYNGTYGNGTVFKISTNGALTTLHLFSGSNEGQQPYAGLVQGSDGNFYGTTSQGGTNNYGTVFTISTNGALTSLYSFRGNDGSYCYAGLVQGSDGYLYGMTWLGGTNNSGTIFRLTIVPEPPQLTIIPSGANVILTWPTDAAGFTLQSTTNLGSAAVWTTNSPAPVVVNGQNIVTNPITGTQMCFRLSQ